MKDRKKCEACSRRTGWISLTAGTLLAAFKLTIGFLGRSRALMASGMCNLSDISSSAMVMLGVRYSGKAPNRRYPYGYGKSESVAQVGISLLMILGNIALILSSFVIIAKRMIVLPHMIVLFTALISGVVNGLIYRFANCAAKELNSPALRSHAEHNKIDVASSILVVIGVLAARVGLHWADPLIAIFECAHVIHGSWIIFWDGFKGLMDTSVPPEYADEIGRRALDIEDVKNVTRVRARQSGAKVFVDLAVQLDPELTVLESKSIIERLESHLKRTDKYIGNLFVQVTPAGDHGV